MKQKINKKKTKKIKEKNQKLKKSRKKTRKKNQKLKKREKESFLVVLDKMCVFFLYPIPDSQQRVKRGSCRRLILSGLLFSF